MAAIQGVGLHDVDKLSLTPPLGPPSDESHGEPADGKPDELVRRHHGAGAEPDIVGEAVEQDLQAVGKRALSHR